MTLQKRGYELRCEKMRCASLRSALQRCGALRRYSLCTNEEAFYRLQGRSERLFRKMTLVFPCFAVYATYEQVLERL